MKNYRVSKECISCRACVQVAEDNFTMNKETKLAYLKKQPENENEVALCEEALEVCPVDAISSDEKVTVDSKNTKPILASANIKTTLDQYPDLKELLVELSPKFKKMQNPVMYNTLARFANFNDASKVAGVSVCEILHVINKYLGVEDKLIKSMPECVSEIATTTETQGTEITWEESNERYIYNNDTIEELVIKVTELKPQENIVIISVEHPNELFKVVEGLGFQYNFEKTREYRISIFNPVKDNVSVPWIDRKDAFEVLDVRTFTTDPFDVIIKKANDIEEDSGFTLIQRFEPTPMISMLSEMGYEHLTDNKAPGEVWIYFHKKIEVEEIVIPWEDRKEDFEVLDVRTFTTDPFDVILKKANDIEEDSGFTLIQKFEPFPLINMLSEMGYEHITEEKNPGEFNIYFHKKIDESVAEKNEDGSIVKTEKIDAVIQSATPIAYPVMMRLLQSARFRKHINIKELKVWEETEKHLAWITSGKADISFSALITSAKLKDSDIKVPALFVWDNFVLLTRYKAESFADIKGKEIYTPLFEEAPPAKITKYLMTASGYNTDDFNFVYGKPFGRPEEIYQDFVTGKADTAILREPEASYAIKMMEDRGEEISVLSFSKIWNEVNPGFGAFPNAGLVLKGEFARKYPKQTKILMEELKKAIEWVNENNTKSAELSFDMMRQPVDRIELFLKRVNFDYVEGEPLVDKVKQYFDVLNKNKVVDMKVDEEFLDMFRL